MSRTRNLIVVGLAVAGFLLTAPRHGWAQG